MVAITSSSGILALLDEDELELKTYALARLDSLVDEFWAEVADGISKIESLYEDEKLPTPTRSLAALVASKVYYHLGDLDEALSYALGAGDKFDVEQISQNGAKGEYIETIISQCIDSYIALKTANEATSVEAEHPPIDKRMEIIVDRMFARCVSTGEYRQALGIALESRRMDVIHSIASTYHNPSSSSTDLLNYILQASMTVVHKVSFRNDILRKLVELFRSQKCGPNYFSITQCFVYLNDPAPASELLKELLESTDEDKILTAYQICFDLAETATQEFLLTVRRSLTEATPGISAAISGDVVMSNPASNSVPLTALDRARAILTGEESIKFYLEFLYRNNHSDLLILTKTKEALDGRSSLYHSAVSFTNAFAHAGTTSDQFLRDNLDWLGKASNWSKFTATAGLGVIHRGNLTQGLQVLAPYLPTPDSGGGGQSGSVYSEGGSLFGLGLVHANRGSPEVIDTLRKGLAGGAVSEVVQHGAALGLGVACMATGNEEVYDDLREVLYNDSAIAGEAAGYAMGLIMLGTGSDKALDEMMQYAHETQHEKIIRGLAIGLALLFYGREEEADSLIESLLSDKDPILRYGGIYTVAMAYAGTGNNKAIRRLLHFAVSDVNDDVRRAAVTSLGFLLFRNPSQVPRIVQLLSESYNSHVRYGAAIALGIACAGTGNEEAIALLEPMTKDTSDYVKQGSCIALAMILIQQNETINPKASTVRKTFEQIIGDKHEDALAKFGAALAQGIIDAGGRNCTVSMRNKNGSPNMGAIVGMALFNQFGYWFPMAHCLSLAFTPTAIVAVNKELNMPKLEFTSGTRPSLFAYQPATKPPQEEKVEKVATAVLSTTAKAKAREKTKKDKAAADEEMDTDEKTPAPETTGGDVLMKTEDADAGKLPTAGEEASGAATSTVAKAKRKPEPTFDTLPNLSRVTPIQLPYISFPQDSRFVPVRPLMATQTLQPSQWPGPSRSSSTAAAAHATLERAEYAASGAGGGILVVKDRKPNEPVELLELTSVKDLGPGEQPQDGAFGGPSGGGSGPSGDARLAAEPIADVPPAFEYDFDS